jgi:hypothetical protein
VHHEFPSRKRFPSHAHLPFPTSLPLSGNANSNKKLKPLLVYGSEKVNLDFRIILILDNACAHVLDYVSLSENEK